MRLILVIGVKAPLRRRWLVTYREREREREKKTDRREEKIMTEILVKSVEAN